MKKVIVFNGPPRSGKDTAVDHLAGKQNTNKLSYKSQLIKFTSNILGVSDEEFLFNYDKKLPDGTWHKDKKIHTIGNKIYSQRSLLIHVSENVIKPSVGDGFFGECLAKNIVEGINLVSDGGFVDELYPVVKAVGAKNTIVVKIHRKGLSFDGDSRSYLPDGNWITINVENNGTLAEFNSKLDDIWRTHAENDAHKQTNWC